MDQTAAGTPTTAAAAGITTIASSSVLVQASQEDVASSISLGSVGPSSVAGQVGSVLVPSTTIPGVATISVDSHQRSISAAPSATPSPVLSPPGKIFGRNTNGTMVATSAPSNEAELQLYRVLQRASLLAYYDTLLEMGGDDVQQLCDAGEEEFLEIMALVGMASKPLHVRRLQKALHEWANNPLAFQTPLPSVDPNQLVYSPESSTSRSKFIVTPTFAPTPLIGTVPHANVGLSPLTTPTGTTSHVTSSSPQLTPTLTEAQVARLSMAAEKLARELPQREPRAHSSKKRTSREIEQVMAMSENDPRRMDEIRKYAAIYGRFDCKRRAEKPLTLHEVCINEAAAQICRFVPPLLTRRDELFPLARKIVKDCGFGHSASIARFGLVQQQPRSDEGDLPGIGKRPRLSSDTTTTSSDYCKDAIEESRHNLFAMYQKMGRPFDLSDITKYSQSRSDYEDNDNDSRFSFSNSSSPPLQLNGTETDAPPMINTNIMRDNLCDSGRDESLKSPIPCTSEAVPTSPLGVQVIAASGGHIIAVANPALAMSPALNEVLNIKREALSPDI